MTQTQVILGMVLTCTGLMFGTLSLIYVLNLCRVRRKARGQPFWSFDVGALLFIFTLLYILGANLLVQLHNQNAVNS